MATQPAPASPQPGLLPPAKYPSRKTLVLDLDGTLISSVCTSDKTPGQGSPQYAYSGKYVWLRPHVLSFLKAIRPHFEVVLFTAATDDWASKALSVLDPSGTLFDFRLYREHTSPMPGWDYVKDLSRLGRSLDSTLIVDDNQLMFQAQPGNAIWVEAYEPADKADDVLLHVQRLLLEKVVPSSSVTEALAPVAAKRFMPRDTTLLQLAGLPDCAAAVGGDVSALAGEDVSSAAGVEALLDIDLKEPFSDEEVEDASESAALDKAPVELDPAQAYMCLSFFDGVETVPRPEPASMEMDMDCSVSDSDVATRVVDAVDMSDAHAESDSDTDTDAYVDADAGYTAEMAGSEGEGCEGCGADTAMTADDAAQLAEACSVQCMEACMAADGGAAELEARLLHADAPEDGPCELEEYASAGEDADCATMEDAAGVPYTLAALAPPECARSTGTQPAAAAVSQEEAGCLRIPPCPAGTAHLPEESLPGPEEPAAGAVATEDAPCAAPFASPDTALLQGMFSGDVGLASEPGIGGSEAASALSSAHCHIPTDADAPAAVLAGEEAATAVSHLCTRDEDATDDVQALQMGSLLGTPDALTDAALTDAALVSPVASGGGGSPGEEEASDVRLLDQGGVLSGGGAVVGHSAPEQHSTGSMGTHKRQRTTSDGAPGMALAPPMMTGGVGLGLGGGHLAMHHQLCQLSESGALPLVMAVAPRDVPAGTPVVAHWGSGSGGDFL